MDDQVTDAPAEARELAELEQRARPFRALYQHWETTQWSAYAIDFATDAESFALLDSEQQRGLVWIFAHRFHAEFNVASLLGPFLSAAQEFEMQLLLATQVADEHRHLQCVLRIYDEVFGVKGGIGSVRAMADENMDPVAKLFYDALDRRIDALKEEGDEEAFLKAIVSYQLLAEGVVARTAQNLAAGQYERLGAFPGLSEGQRLVARDEARHIGIGVSYARRRMNDDRERTVAAVTEVLDEFGELAEQSLTIAQRGMEDLLAHGYGVDAEAFHREAMRLLQLRLRSIGYLEE